jgi:hypothetical protein
MKLHGYSTSMDLILTSAPVRVMKLLGVLWLILRLVFFSYVVVTYDSVILFVERDHFMDDAHTALGDTVDVRHTVPS